MASPAGSWKKFRGEKPQEKNNPPLADGAGNDKPGKKQEVRN